MIYRVKKQPFSKEYVIVFRDKASWVCSCGSIHCGHIEKVLEEISLYNLIRILVPKKHRLKTKKVLTL